MPERFETRHENERFQPPLVLHIHKERRRSGQEGR